VKRRHDRDLYPADVKIVIDPTGKPSATGPWVSQTPPPPYLCVCCEHGIAIGVASEQQIALALEPAHVGLEPCAKVALRRLEGVDFADDHTLQSTTGTETTEKGHVFVVNCTERRLRVHVVREGGHLLGLAM
jgi:hypothetical protein